MDKVDAIRMAILGLLLNSHLYLGGVIAVGVVTGNPFAWRLGLIAAGLCYIGYACQLSNVPRKITAVVVWSSIAAGVIAGISLL